MSNIFNQAREFDNNCRRESINENLLKCYKLICKKIHNKDDPNMKTIIKHHKTYISKSGIRGKKKYSTLNLLIHFNNTKDKKTAFMTLTNSLNNKKIFRN